MSHKNNHPFGSEDLLAAPGVSQDGGGSREQGTWSSQVIVATKSKPKPPSVPPQGPEIKIQGKP